MDDDESDASGDAAASARHHRRLHERAVRGPLPAPARVGGGPLRALAGAADRPRRRHHDAPRDAPRRWRRWASMPAATSACRSRSAWCSTSAGRDGRRRRRPQIATSWNRLFEMLGGALGAGAPTTWARISCALSQDRRRGHGPLRRRHLRRPATSWSAPTACARPCGRRYLPAAQPLYAGYVAWRGLLDEQRGGAGAGPGAVRPVQLLPAARRAVPGLSGGRPRQRPAAGASQLERRVVPPRRRGARAAAAADRRDGPHARALDPAAADRARRRRRDARRRRAAAAAAVPRCRGI